MEINSTEDLCLASYFPKCLLMATSKDKRRL